MLVELDVGSAGAVPERSSRISSGISAPHNLGAREAQRHACREREHVLSHLKIEPGNFGSPKSGGLPPRCRGAAAFPLTGQFRMGIFRTLARASPRVLMRRAAAGLLSDRVHLALTSVARPPPAGWAALGPPAPLQRHQLLSEVVRPNPLPLRPRTIGGHRDSRYLNFLLQTRTR
jgi:hypothetical protein